MKPPVMMRRGKIEDLDLWISTDPKNAAAVYRSLQQFGAPLNGLEEKDFAKSKKS